MVVVGKATDTNHLYLSSTLQRKPPTPDLINNLDQQAASMKYSIVLSVMSTLAAAAPLAINNPPIVTIALIDEPTCKALNANFTQPPGTSTNNPIGPWMMEIPLDVMQDFSKKPQQIVEIDVQHITAGIESHGFEVMADDPAVVCDVGVAAANDILVKMGSGRTRVTNLEYAQVTSLYCYKRLSI
ncbi:uncharacterized protein SETTUDRAFT_28818 [Exserohilum turcica Et28A]|uniref:Uncharacterized protein n=1 Tax=Exserohilum turcicum (strain 28A) TaxID=671987 RepID=R0K8R6_EXST2|nr:uncharacterized protein SETTUDRAFT_28818 [Exserohilum turcica Et28A]EOA85854.1 hypothetical protein SETTUDRAFT_28818 [Exserohilum turcica Et28A]